MAISYVGGLTAQITVASPTTQSISLTSLGLAAGDFVIVGYGEGAGGNATLSGRISTSGYSLITELYAADGNNSNLAVFTKFMGSTPDSSVVVVGATSSNAAATVNIQVWRGVDTTTPLDATTTTATGSNSGNANPAAITPVTTGNVIALFANSASAAADTATFTAGSTAYMTGFQQIARAGGTYRGLGGQGYVTGQARNVSYDPAAWALSTDSTTYAWTAATITLRPAPAVIDGSASSTFAVTGASSGAVSISGASSGDMAISGASIASVLAAASASGTIDLSGSASGGGAKMLVAAGSIDIAGSATATVQLSAAASGQIDLTGSAQGGVAIVAASSGQIGITGAADGEVSYNTGEASGTLAFTGAAIGAIYVQGSVSGAISFSLASYGKHLWLQQPPTDETWSVQAANSEIWQPVSGSGTAWE